MEQIRIPTKLECFELLAKYQTPDNVIEHSKKVCEIAEEISDKLIKKGIKVNRNLVIAAALLHDVVREREDHVAAGSKLLKSLGFPEVALIISKHSLYEIEDEAKHPLTIEEKIVFYADKRSKGNKKVTLKERFDDLKKRYNINLIDEFKFAEKIEKELEEK